MIKEVFGRWDRKLDVMAEDLKIVGQRVASLEHDTRQPRLAMEADGQADTKTSEHSEGAATAVQAVRGDRCSANRVDLDPMCSTSFGDDCTGPPAPPSHVSHPYRCEQHQPPVTSFPLAKLLQQQRPPTTSNLFGSTRPGRRFQRRQI